LPIGKLFLVGKFFLYTEFGAGMTIVMMMMMMMLLLLPWQQRADWLSVASAAESYPADRNV